MSTALFDEPGPKARRRIKVATVAGALAAVALVALAMALGLVLALGRLSHRSWVRAPAAAYVEVVRVIPALLLVYVVLFALPRYGLDLPLFWKLTVPLTVSNAAAYAEIFRAGIVSIERGQTEAAWPSA
ncbi:ABC transporter permease subunit [Nonomuraea fuscirosea]|uniref:ABC transporter permease subunit n=1 Tax=Nonomuraea fuscirosea TaxID=1291556 RepID=UPI0034162A49